MKKLNKKSDLYYVSKVTYFKPFNLYKVFLIDDDCNEFLATVKAEKTIITGYVKPEEITVIDYEEYSSEKWYEMIAYSEYERMQIW